ncbi:unnamed protein product [Parajaminaea phylloscopi]
MATKAASRRLAKEYQMMQKDPPAYCFAKPMETDILTWHFILRGPPDTPYAGGEYWGQLMFPSDYPYKPPGIKVHTPNGRFKENEKICTSFSDFHPGSYNPAWSVSNILVGLLSLWTSEEMTTGGMNATESARKTLAGRSHGYNVSQLQFKKVFPEYAEDRETPKELPNMGGNGAGSSSKAGATTLPAKTAPKTPQNDDRVTEAPAASTAEQAHVQQPLLSTRSKMAIFFALIAWLFIGRLMQRAKSSPSHQ